MRLLFGLSDRGFGSLRQCFGVLMLRTRLTTYIGTIRAAPIRVRGVVVVGVASGVDVPRVVGVAAIG